MEKRRKMEEEEEKVKWNRIYEWKGTGQKKRQNSADKTDQSRTGYDRSGRDMAGQYTTRHDTGQKNMLRHDTWQI